MNKTYPPQPAVCLGTFSVPGPPLPVVRISVSCLYDHVSLQRQHHPGLQVDEAAQEVGAAAQVEAAT